MKKLLARQNASTTAMGRFYLAAVQSILLYGSDTWTLTSQQLRLLDSFHHHCARHITHMHIRPLPDGTWITPASTDVLQAAGLKPISTYIQKRREHVTEFAKNLPIYAKCDKSKSTKNTGAHMYWWLLPNDIITPPATPTLVTAPHPTNRHRPHLSLSVSYHNRRTPRPHTILLNHSDHPMRHTTYHDTPTSTTIPTSTTASSPTTSDIDTTTTATADTTTTHPCSLSHASILPIHYDHDHDSHASTNPDMTRRRLMDIPLPLPLPPPPIPYDHLRQIPPQPPSIAPPTQIEVETSLQEPPLPESPDPDDFFLPDHGDSDSDADSNTDSDSDSLASTASLLSLHSYGDLDDLDDLNFSDLEEDTL